MEVSSASCTKSQHGFPPPWPTEWERCQQW